MYHPRHLEHHKEQMHRHACTCTQVLAYTPAVLAHTHTHARAHTHTHTRAHTHRQAHTHARAHAHTRTHACMHARKQARMHSRARACTLARTRTQERTHTHKHACTHSSFLVQHFGQGDMLFYRLACVHMCVWHRTTDIALYLGPKSRQIDIINLPNLFFAREHCARYPACLPYPMLKFLRQEGVLTDTAAEIRCIYTVFLAGKTPNIYGVYINTNLYRYVAI